MKNSFRFFCNFECESFPCHRTDEAKDFNCLFCYCPLYPLGEKCGGNCTYTEDGIKDCSGCLIPHSVGGYDYVVSRFKDVAELARKKDV
jgi:Zn-finger protein